MSKKKYLELYYGWIHQGSMDKDGLCDAFGKNRLFKLFIPQTVEEFPFYPDPISIRFAYWAADGETSGYASERKFTPLRQTIVLLMAAMNGEL